MKLAAFSLFICMTLSYISRQPALAYREVVHLKIKQIDMKCKANDPGLTCVLFPKTDHGHVHYLRLHVCSAVFQMLHHNIMKWIRTPIVLRCKAPSLLLCCVVLFDVTCYPSHSRRAVAGICFANFSQYL